MESLQEPQNHNLETSEPFAANTGDPSAKANKNPLKFSAMSQLIEMAFINV